MKLAMSNFARKFIGVLGRESPILGNFAPPEAQNRTNRRATASIADRHQSPLLTVHSPSVDGTGVYRQYLPLACGYMADTEDGRTCYYYYYASTRLALQHSQSCLMFVFSYCRILASLKHPHIVAFHESIHDADKKVLFIIQVIFIIIRLHRSDSQRQRPITTHGVPWSVCVCLLCVCVLLTFVSPATTAELIVVLSRVGPRNHVLNGSADPLGRRKFFGRGGKWRSMCRNV